MPEWRQGYGISQAKAKAAREREEKDRRRAVIRQAFSTLADFTTGVGGVKGIQEAVQGKDVVTGRKLGTAERVITGATAPLDFLPGGALLGAIIPLRKQKKTYGAIQSGRHLAPPQIRKEMQSEFKARGKPLQGGIATDYPWASGVLRGSWFHGRREYPLPGMDYIDSRARIGNIGEPTGLSLSAWRQTPHQFARPTERMKHVEEVMETAKVPAWSRYDKLLRQRTDMDDAIIQDLANKYGGISEIPQEVYNDALWNSFKTKDLSKQAEITRARALRHDEQIKSRLYKYLSDKPTARVLPRFGGPPEEKVIAGWKSELESLLPHQEDLRNAYETAIRNTPGLKESVEEYMKTHRGPFDRDDLYHIMSENLSSGGKDRELFNKLVTDELMSKGYKGVLYNPARYNEFEMRMFDPADVMQIDTRRMLSDPAIRRVFGTRGTADKSAYESFPEVAIGGELHIPGYVPRTRKLNALAQWQTALEYTPPSLRQVYEDVPLEKIFKPRRVSLGDISTAGKQQEADKKTMEWVSKTAAKKGKTEKELMELWGLTLKDLED